MFIVHRFEVSRYLEGYDGILVFVLVDEPGFTVMSIFPDFNVKNSGFLQSSELIWFWWTNLGFEHLSEFEV